MDGQLTKTELIRRLALLKLINYPSGVRPAFLKAELEKELEGIIPPDDKSSGLFRSALWDLEKRYPQYVFKEIITTRHTVLNPKAQLFDDIDKLEIPNIEDYREESKNEEPSPLSQYIYTSIFNGIVEPKLELKEKTLPIIKNKCIEITDFIDQTEIQNIIDMTLEEAALDYGEMEALYRLQFCLDMLTKYRKELLNGKF